MNSHHIQAGWEKRLGESSSQRKSPCGAIQWEETEGTGGTEQSQGGRQLGSWERRGERRRQLISRGQITEVLLDHGRDLGY